MTFSAFLKSRAFVQRYTNLFCATIADTISPISACIRGSPPAIETTGASHSSTALKHWSTDNLRSRIGSYSRMRPQPVQVRLQASSGSRIIVSGKRSRPRSFWRKRYQASLIESLSGLPDMPKILQRTTTLTNTQFLPDWGRGAVAPEPTQNSVAAALAIPATGPNLLVRGGFAQSLTLQDERDGETREEPS